MRIAKLDIDMCLGWYESTYDEVEPGDVFYFLDRDEDIEVMYCPSDMTLLPLRSALDFLGAIHMGAVANINIECGCSE